MFKNVQKQISLKNQSANFLLGFNYQDEDYSANGQSAYGKRGNRGKRRAYVPTKDYNI